MEHDAEPREELQTVQTALDHEVPVLAAVAETVEVDSAAVAERVVVALAAAAGGEVIDWAAVAMGFEGGVVDNLVAVVEMRAV